MCLSAQTVQSPSHMNSQVQVENGYYQLAASYLASTYVFAYFFKATSCSEIASVAASSVTLS